MSDTKKFEDLTPNDYKTLKVEFAPGCFDDFEGSQEELDELIAEITKMIHTGEVLDGAPVDLDQLIEEDPKLAKKLIDSINDTATRLVQ